MHAQRFGYEGPAIERPSLMNLFARKAAINFLRQPVQSSGLIVMGLASLTIMANALYFQPGMHPAPLFGQKAPRHIAALEPVAQTLTDQNALQSVSNVTPFLRPKQIAMTKQLMPAPLVGPSAQNVGAIDLSNAQGNKLAFEVQTLLASMGLFNQKRDGYYGPDTAQAIRAFERAQGLRESGQMSAGLTAQLYTALQGGVIANPAPVVAPIAAVRPVVKPTAITDILNRSVDASVAAAVAQVAVAAKSTELTHLVNKVTTRKILMEPKALQAVAEIATKQMMPAVVKPKGPPPALVENIQRGLSSLGFLHGKIDGVAGDATAAAIRQFENYNRFPITGEVNAHILTLLIASGADIS